MTNNKLKINEAASYLGVSIYTLRRWDDNGTLKSSRINQSSHRYYNLNQLDDFLVSFCFDLATKWVSSNFGKEPNDIFYCADSSVFQGRLYKLRKALSENKEIESSFSLLISVVGEIGDNSFGHNLGNWPDIAGVFFAYDTKKRMVVLADRGQGILKTLKRVRSELKSDEEALRIAFTEIISGRAPESRGNGLKYVKAVIEKNPFSLFFQSGKAKLNLNQNDSTLKIKKAKKPISGCLAVIKF
ncbi:MAG: MerR family transcriptional regulator [Patescibacteria group bacterium]|nr:MerR family transcriptional regulator [Patescibacteria group bacterium]